MGHIAAIGEPLSILGLASAGVLLSPAESADDARAAWRNLPPDVDLVILTPTAAHALAPEAVDGQEPLVAVMPP
ncbi:hypothetical protein ACIGDI_08135 [Streptomyces sp. NPDC085900]|uniref:hypothetical protein n=1 Tax=Streptomyces sp. NPDC085900 TaxID=3365737 RepID=UPI0037D4CD1C